MKTRVTSTITRGQRGFSLFCIIPLLALVLLLASCGSTSLDPSTGGNGPTTIQQAPKAKLTYVAIGASDTYGQGADDPHSQSWPADLAALLGLNVRLINLGVSGIVAHQALNADLPVTIDSHADLVTIWLAVNDLADRIPLDSYSHDLEALISRLQIALPKARIVVANVPDLSLLPAFSNIDPQTLSTQILAYNNAIASIVARHHVLLLDLYQRWSELHDHPEYISSDGRHPSTLGYARLASLFYQVLQ